VYTFGGLVLPCIAARHLCRRVLPMLIVGPILGLATGVVAFVLANHWNQPPGQMTVALLCLVVAGSSLARRLRRAG
jgi:ABC-type Mn2+/Zn2+ transport system permease subunit